MLPRTKIIIACIVILLALIFVDQWRRRTLPEDGKSDMAQEGVQETPAVVSTATSDWKEFTPQSGKFKVMLPALPQHASEAVPLPSGQGMIKYDMYLSQEKDGTTYMISLIQYPDNFDTANTEELLNGVMKEMMSGSANNKLINSEKGVFRQATALDFAIQNSDVFIRSKTFLVSKTLFVLTLIDRNPQGVEELFKKFIDSFTLGEPAKTENKQEVPPAAQPTEPLKNSPAPN